MRILGLDYGDKYVGLAMSDPGCIIASPYKTIHRETEENLKATVREIRALCEQEDIHQIVLGFPKNMNNTLGERAQKTLAFKKRLERDLYQVEVVLWDERLSTRQAEAPMLAQGYKADKRKEYVDAMAAALILQGYLDAQATAAQNGAEPAREGFDLENAYYLYNSEEELEVEAELLSELTLEEGTFALMHFVEEEDPEEDEEEEEYFVVLLSHEAGEYELRNENHHLLFYARECPYYESESKKDQERLDMIISELTEKAEEYL